MKLMNKMNDVGTEQCSVPTIYYKKPMLIDITAAIISNVKMMSVIDVNAT